MQAVFGAKQVSVMVAHCSVLELTIPSRGRGSGGCEGGSELKERVISTW